MSDSQQPPAYINVVLDLETLGLSEDAAILQIGCAIPKFDHYKIPNLTPHFTATVKYETAINSEFAKDSSTLDWWEKQSLLARKVVFSGQDSYEDVLHQFEFWIQTIKLQGLTVRMWGNGPEFDNRLLDYTLRAYNVRGLWDFRDNHSIRTLKTLFPITIVEDPVHELKHTALGDALYEARLMHEIKMHYKNQLENL